MKMKRYSDYSEISKVEWTKYKIVVPTEKDKKDIKEALSMFHYSSDFDSDIVTVNQLGHEYLDPEDMGGHPGNIIVDKELYEKLNSIYK